MAGLFPTALLSVMVSRRWRGVCVALVGLAALYGCQENTRQDFATLPLPSFAGPQMAPPAPRPLPQVRPWTPAKAAAVATGNVPASWIPNASPRPWKWIVIHHSATPTGGAKKFDIMHREKGWDELGYHFVIGNGTDTGNGQVEVGSRWPKQKWGAHAKTPDNKFNDFGVGICLVGNFDIDRPSPEQLKSCAKLVSFLMKTYKIPASNVLGHRNTKPTECPGRNTNIEVIRQMATQMLAESGDQIEPSPLLASDPNTELLTDTAGH